MTRLEGIGSIGLMAAVLTLSGCQAGPPASATQANTETVSASANAAGEVPIYEWDPSWPKQPLPNQWSMGNVGALTVDSQDHIWVTNRPRSVLAGHEDDAAYPEPEAECCVPPPAVIEFDQAGNVVQGWGGPGPEYEWPLSGNAEDGPMTDNNPVTSQRPRRVQGAPRDYHWPRSEHGIAVDYKGNVWVGGSDVLKFTRDGKFLGLEIGYDPTGKAKINQSQNTKVLQRPTGIVIDPQTNEVFIADGYANRRVIVFDADTGAFKRQWGAFGKPPDDMVPLRKLPFKWQPSDPPHTAFSVVHCLHFDKDNRVYVCDRGNSRIQVFERDGTFVKEAYVRPTTLRGSVFDLAFSHDPEQRFVFVADGRNEKVWILRRSDLQVIGEFGHAGQFGGGFTIAHAIATDSQNNIYVGESLTGNRVQRFVYKGLGPRKREYDRYGIAAN